MKKLVRSKSDTKLAGICAGLADYFDVDPTIMRVLFVISIFVTAGGAILAYIVLWLIIPAETTSKTTETKTDKES